MSAKPYERDDLAADYARLGYRHGWTFLMTRAARLRDARVAFVGLNPGGGGAGDDHPYEETWDQPLGNAYFVESWGPNGSLSPIQRQVQAWHTMLGIGADESLCAQFVPFRSPDWHRLDRKEEALAVAARLWRGVLDVSPASLLVTMGKLPAEHLGSLLEGRVVATLPTGWGNSTIDVLDTPGGRRIVAMPHPSRYQLFNRLGNASEQARQSLRIAAGLEP